MTKKEEKAREVLANRKTAFAARVRTLTGHVLDRQPAGAMMKAFAAGKTADQYAAEIAAREPIGAALHTQKAEAINSAALDAAKTISSVQEKLEAAGWDLDVAAPYPRHNDYTEYKTKAALHNLFSSLTISDYKLLTYRPRGEPNIVKMSETGIDRFIRQAEEAAAIQYDMFICKMVKKVGPTATAATIAGDHIWSHSILFVVHADGRNEKWKTQQIWNTSIHGLRFPQWPSRVVK